MKNSQTQNRETDGRYSNGHETMCRCGHSLGMHTAAKSNGSQPCIVGDFGGEICECECFRKAAKRSVTP